MIFDEKQPIKIKAENHWTLRIFTFFPKITISILKKHKKNKRNEKGSHKSHPGQVLNQMICFPEKSEIIFFAFCTIEISEKKWKSNF